MSSVTRKPDGTMVVTVRLTLKPGRDDPLIDLVRSAPARRLAAYIREAMRSGICLAAAGEEEEWLDLSGLGEAL